MSVQQSIVKGIRELLFHHDYLVLPGFGGFVLKPDPAHFSAAGTTLLPPRKTVSFNVRLKQNDSLLALWLQQELQCSSAEALGYLNDFTDYCLALLNARRRLNLEGIGFFYLDLENNIGFEPQEEINFLTDSFGLGPVQLTAVEQVQETKEQTIFQDRSIVVPDQRPVVRTRRNLNRLVVPAAFLGLLFSLLAFFVANNKISGPLRASVFGAENTGSYEPIAYPDLNLLNNSVQAPAYVADANGIASLELGDKVLAVKALDIPVTRPRGVAHRNYNFSLPGGRFEIVMGCFNVPANAVKLADKISASHPLQVRVSGRNDKGMYVVSTGNFGSKEEALAGLQAIRADYPKAWIK